MVSWRVRRVWVSELIAQQWKQAFLTTIRQHEYAVPLQVAAQEGKQEWTMAMTRAVVATCKVLGWQAAARDHVSDCLPVARSEYLNIDVMAFVPGQKCWRYPIAIIELENQSNDDYIAYDLWKLLCVSADLRIVYCYRTDAQAGSTLATFLAHDVVGALTVQQRTRWPGETMLVIGSHADRTTFPYGFFRWWLLDMNVERFVPLV